MINEQGLWDGQRVRVQQSTRDGQDIFALYVDRWNVVSEFFDKGWANAFAEVIECLIPPGVGRESALRHVYDGLLSLAHTRFLVAGVLERAAEKTQARSLDALDDRERGQLSRAAYELREQAKLLRASA